MYLINRDFPLKPGPKCLKVDDMRILTAQKQPSAPDVLKVVKNGASSVVFVVQKQMESLVSSILTQNGYLLSPDHLRIFIAGREETKKNKNTPIFWIQKSGKIDGFFSIFPVNDVANYTLL